MAIPIISGKTDAKVNIPISSYPLIPANLALYNNFIKTRFGANLGLIEKKISMYAAILLSDELDVPRLTIRIGNAY